MQVCIQVVYIEGNMGMEVVSVVHFIKRYIGLLQYNCSYVYISSSEIQNNFA